MLAWCIADPPPHRNDLQQDLQNIDQQGYGAYKRLLDSRYQHRSGFALEFLHIQGDPYAPPSRARIIRSLDGIDIPHMPERVHRVATADFVTRLAADFIRSKSLDRNESGKGGWAGPKGGAFNINAPGQEVLERTSCVITSSTIEIRFTVALPARGRSISGGEAWTILGTNLPLLTDHCLNMSLCVGNYEEHLRSGDPLGRLTAEAKAPSFHPARA